LLGILANMKLKLLLCLAPFAAASPFLPYSSLASRDAKANYDGYHVYSVTPSSALEARKITKRFERYHTQHIRDTLSVVIPPEEVDSFKSPGLEARLLNSDLGSFIRSTEAKAPTYNNALHKRGELPDLSWYDSYHDYADHLTYWDDLVGAFPDNSEKFEIGKSYENRSMYAFHLFGDDKKGPKGRGKGHDRPGKHGKKEVEKPIVLWHATVHAREVCCQSTTLITNFD
jgi:hypothetical protein